MRPMPAPPTRIPRRALGLGLAAAVAGCASPNPRLYTIAVVPGPSFPRSPKIVLLRELSIARYLERTQLVASSEDYRLDVRANDWWGEPLSAMLGRVLVQELGDRLPASAVYGENGAVTTEPDATVELNIERMDENAAGQLVLIAQAGIVRSGPVRIADARRSFHIVVTPSGSDIPAQVAATSAAVGQLADGLAAMLASA